MFQLKPEEFNQYFQIISMSSDRARWENCGYGQVQRRACHQRQNQKQRTSKQIIDEQFTHTKGIPAVIPVLNPDFSCFAFVLHVFISLSPEPKESGPHVIQ